jgi:hypothetical protein
MAISPKALASWGLLSDTAGGGATQIIRELEITLAADEPLPVELEAAEMSVELSDAQ